MPTYIVKTTVRRTWRERLLSWPWKPWQATKIVAEQVTGPYPWDAKPGEMASIFRPFVQKTRLSVEADLPKPGQVIDRQGQLKDLKWKPLTPEQATKIIERRRMHQQEPARAAMVRAMRDETRPAPGKIVEFDSRDDLATSMLAHHVHHTSLMQAPTTWPDPPAAECTPTTTDTGSCCDTSSSDSGSSSCGE